MQKKANLFDFYAEVHPIFVGHLKYSENRVQKKANLFDFYAEVHPIFDGHIKYSEKHTTIHEWSPFYFKKNTQSTLCLPYLLYIIMYKYKKRLNMVEN